MSSVRKKDRAENRFTVLDLCLDVYEHTTTVTANQKLDRTYASILDRINESAALAYHCVRAANEDYDNRDKEEAKIRLGLQEEALEHCRWLKTYIRLAQKIFHMRARKVIAWNDKVNIAMKAITAWHQAEVRTYKELHGM